MSVNLQAELVELRRSILRMGASVESRVRQVVSALVDRDIATAREVRTGDDEIDEMDLDIDEECLTLLALSHGVMAWFVRQFAADRRPASERSFRWFNEVPTLLFIGIVILAVFQPGR